MKSFFFKYRGFTPIPFFMLALIYAKPIKDLFVFGIILIAFGELIRIWGVSYTGGVTRTRKIGDTPVLVTNGPYAFMRNPLYFGNIFMYSGFIIASGALLPYLLYIVILFFSFQYSLIISLEENILTEQFGKQYEHYKGSVPRFYMRISPYPDRTKIRPDIKKALKSEKTTFLVILGLVILFAIRLYLFN